MFDDRAAAMELDAVVTQSNDWYLEFVQFRAALGLGWKTPNILICLSY